MKTSEQWTSKLGFILAAAGSAIGLGAIWKFPYVVGTNGGGAFFLLFIIFTVAIGLPLLMAEFVIGRSSGKEAVSAYTSIAPNSYWSWVGKIGIISCFILLSFYSVVGGWILLYLWKCVTGNLLGTEIGYSAAFESVIADPLLAIGAQVIFMLLTIVVVARGVQNGIEKASKYMMPALFLLFLVLIVRAVTLPNAMGGLSFFLSPDFSKINGKSILEAMGQAFFSLSVGASVMVTYSSYLEKKESLTRSAVSIVGLCLLISLLAGFAIFPAVFAAGVEPAAGPGLLFIVLPSVFEQIPFGGLFLLLFLILFLFATLTSAFSMLEIIVAAVAKGEQSRRKKWTWLIGICITAVGVPSALSYGVMEHVTLFGKTVFDLSDYLVSNILLPLGALFSALFVPYKIKRDVLYQEFTMGSTRAGRWFAAWLFMLRFIIPAVIICVFLGLLGFM